MLEESSSREQLLEEVERLRQRVSLMEASAHRHGETMTEKETGQAPPDTGTTGRSYERKGKRARLEQALVAAEQNFRNSLDNSPLGVIIIAEDEEIVYANQSLLDIYGYDSLEELRNTPRSQRLTPESYAAYQDRQQRWKTGQPVPRRYEISIVRKNGNIRYLEAYRNEILWNGGKQHQVLYKDITEQRQAEKALRESEERFATAFNLSPHDMTISTFPEGRYIEVNDAFEKLSGFSHEEVIGRTATELGFWPRPEDRETIIRILTEKGRVRDFPVVLRRRSGELVFGEISMDIIVLNGQKCILSEFCNITERRKTQEALRQSEEKLRHIFGCISDGIMVIDMMGIIIEANDRMVKMSKAVSKDDLVGRHFLSLISHHEHEKAREAGRVTLNDGFLNGIEYTMLGDDGLTFPVEINASVFRGADGKPMGQVGIVRDVTERKKAEAALQETETKLQLLLEQMPCILWATNRDLEYTASLGAGLATLNLSPDELVGMTLYEYYETEDPDYPAVIAHRRALDGEATTYDLEWMGRTFHCYVEPLHDAAGGINGVIGTAFDISERKRAEEQLRAVARRLVTIQEEERRLLGRELHEQVGQTLTALHLLLSKAVQGLAAQGVIASASLPLQEAQVLSNELIGQVRTMSFDLRPAMLDDLGLLPTLVWYFDKFEAKTQVHVNFKHVCLKKKFPVDTCTAAYRIVEEALDNIVRHAGVKEVNILARTNSGVLTLRIQDRGDGFDPASLVTGQSSGLDSMRERALAVGGIVTIESIPGKGTTITAELPCLLPRKRWKKRVQDWK